MAITFCESIKRKENFVAENIVVKHKGPKMFQYSHKGLERANIPLLHHSKNHNMSHYVQVSHHVFVKAFQSVTNDGNAFHAYQLISYHLIAGKVNM